MDKNKDLVVGTEDLGAEMHQWHSSQSDPIYGVGSYFYAGHPVERSRVEEAIARLKKMTWKAEGTKTVQNDEVRSLVAKLEKLLQDQPPKGEVVESAGSDMSDEHLTDALIKRASLPASSKEDHLPYIAKGGGKPDIWFLHYRDPKYVDEMGQQAPVLGQAMGRVDDGPPVWKGGMRDIVKKALRRNGSASSDKYGFRAMGRAYFDPRPASDKRQLQFLYNVATNTSSIWDKYVSPAIEKVKEGAKSGNQDRGAVIKLLLKASDDIIKTGKKEFTEEFPETFPGGKVSRIVLDAVAADIMDYVEAEYGTVSEAKEHVPADKYGFRAMGRAYADPRPAADKGPMQFLYSVARNTSSIWGKYVEPAIEKMKKDNKAGTYDRKTIIEMLLEASDDIVATAKREFTEEFPDNFPGGTVRKIVLDGVAAEILDDIEGEYGVEIKHGVNEEAKPSAADKSNPTAYSKATHDASTMSQKEIDVRLSEIKAEIANSFGKHDSEHLAKLHDEERALIHASSGTSSESVNESVSVIVSGDADDPADAATMRIVSNVLLGVLGRPTAIVAGVVSTPDAPPASQGGEQKAEAAVISEAVAAPETSSIIKRQLDQSDAVIDTRLRKQVGASALNQIGLKLEDIPSVEATSTNGLIIFSSKDPEVKQYVAASAAKIAADHSVPTDAPLVVVFPSQFDALKKEVARVTRVLQSNVEGRKKPNWVGARTKIQAILGEPVRQGAQAPAQPTAPPATPTPGTAAESTVVEGAASDEKKPAENKEPRVLTPEEGKSFGKRLVKDGIPVRFLTSSGQAFDVVTGELSSKGSNVIYHPHFWHFDEPTAREIAALTNTKPVFDQSGLYGKVGGKNRAAANESTDALAVELMLRRAALSETRSTVESVTSSVAAAEKKMFESTVVFGGKVRSGPFVLSTSGSSVVVEQNDSERLIEVEVGDAPKVVVEGRRQIAELTASVEESSGVVARLEEEARSCAVDGVLRGKYADVYVTEGGAVLVSPKPFESTSSVYESIVASKLFALMEGFDAQAASAAGALVKMLEESSDKAVSNNMGLTLKIEGKDFVAESGDVGDVASILMESGVDEPWLMPLVLVSEHSRYKSWTIPEAVVAEAAEFSEGGFALVLGSSVFFEGSSDSPCPKGACCVGGDWTDGSDLWDTERDAAAPGVSTIVNNLDMYSKRGEKPRKGSVLRKDGKTYLLDKSGPKPLKRLSRPDSVKVKGGEVCLSDCFEPSMALAQDTCSALTSKPCLESAVVLSRVVGRWLSESGNQEASDQLAEDVLGAVSFCNSAPKVAALVVGTSAKDAFDAAGDSVKGNEEVGEKIAEFVEKLKDPSLPAVNERAFERGCLEFMIEATSLDDNPSAIGSIVAKAERTLVGLVSSDQAIPANTMRLVLTMCNDVAKLGQKLVYQHREEAPQVHADLEKAPTFTVWSDLMINKAKAPDSKIDFSKELRIVLAALVVLQKKLSSMTLRDQKDNQNVDNVERGVASARNAARLVLASLDRHKPTTGTETAYDEAAKGSDGKTQAERDAEYHLTRPSSGSYSATVETPGDAKRTVKVIKIQKNSRGKGYDVFTGHGTAINVHPNVVEKSISKDLEYMLRSNGKDPNYLSIRPTDWRDFLKNAEGRTKGTREAVDAACVESSSEIEPGDKDVIKGRKVGQFWDFSDGYAEKASKLIGINPTRRAGVDVVSVPYHLFDKMEKAAEAASVKLVIEETPK